MAKTMIDSSVFSAMQTGKPLKSYRKTILAKVLVKILNPFSGEPEERILSGSGITDETVVDVWSEQEDVFFKRANRNHFAKGLIVEYVRPETVEVSEEEKLNTLSDEELSNLLNSKWMTFKNSLNKMTAVAPVYRLLEMANEQEKSEKTILAIKARLAELELK